MTAVRAPDPSPQINLTSATRSLMGIQSYEVVNIRGDWHVTFAADLYGPFRAQPEAIAAAKSWAIKQPPSVVIVEVGPGEFETVWTSDDLPLPLVE